MDTEKLNKCEEVLVKTMFIFKKRDGEQGKKGITMPKVIAGDRPLLSIHLFGGKT